MERSERRPGLLLTIVGELFGNGQLAFFLVDPSGRPFLETIQLFQEGFVPNRPYPALSGRIRPCPAAIFEANRLCPESKERSYSGCCGGGVKPGRAVF